MTGPDATTSGNDEAAPMTTPDDLACQELVEQVTEYLEAALGPEDRARFETHTEECPACAEVLEQFRVVVATVGSLRAADVSTIDAATRDHLLMVFRDWASDRH